MTVKENNSNIDIPVEKLIFDSPYGRYSLVIEAAKIIKELKKKEEYKNMSHNNLLEIALREAILRKKSHKKDSDVKEEKRDEKE